MSIVNGRSIHMQGDQVLSVTQPLSATALLWMLVPPVDNVSPARLSLSGRETENLVLTHDNRGIQQGLCGTAG